MYMKPVHGDLPLHLDAEAMEGPSLYLAAQQLKPFKKQVVRSVHGNTKQDKARLKGLVVKDIFSWGKHLVFQFDTFALRIHFMLFGTFEARVQKEWVTGDYRRAREPRLAMKFDNGEINTYSCSVKFFEDANLKKSYDFSIDIMSPKWDPKRAAKNMRLQPKSQIADVLLDQEVFAGVGNIIKNEVLSIVRLNPKTRIDDLSDRKLRDVITATRAFSKQFLAWRRKFVLRKNLKIHRKGTCPHCGHKVIREKTGARERWAFWCPVCQKLTQ
jgi:endonuclease VIII